MSTLRDRLGALVREWRKQDDTTNGICNNINLCCHGLCAHELEAALAAQPAPAVMVEDDARKRLLYEPLGDFSFSQHVAAKLSTLLTAKYTNSQKIVAGIIKQEIEAVFREVDAEGRTAAAESREELKTATEIMLRADAERDKARLSDIQNRLREARRGNTEVELFYRADVQWLVDAVTRLGHLWAARQPGESPT